MVLRVVLWAVLVYVGFILLLSDATLILQLLS